MSAVLRTILRGVVAASLAVVSSPATAAPPEGCVGFPDIPEAWICVTSWTPQNAAPRTGTAGSTTFVVPQFCAFSQCVGPTPVTVPGVFAGQGGGAIATITYRGETVTVPVAVAPVARLSGTLTVECYGCGPSTGPFRGVFTGVLNGHSYAGANMTGMISISAPNVTCVNPYGQATMSASGTLTVSDGTQVDSVQIALTSVGPAAVASFLGTTAAAVAGTRIVTSPLTNPCSIGLARPVSIYLDLSGVR
ncbi:MAG TPA: hypothetical protein VNA20_08765 [Frankiaceae bacterium]|nr:hypothetical protein [Frankiaceae bacterium]